MCDILGDSEGTQLRIFLKGSSVAVELQVYKFIPNQVKRKKNDRGTRNVTVMPCHRCLKSFIQLQDLM